MLQHDIPLSKMRGNQQMCHFISNTQIPNTHSLIVPEHKAKALKTEALWTIQILHVDVSDEQETSIDGEYFC
jgi:hypothetical protein